jgi:predicted porin
MKLKHTIAAAMTVVSAPVFANSVELYGTVDAGISHMTGLAGGAQTAVVSGVMSGSQLGFRGQEDLGGGYKLMFTLEQRIEMDTGANFNEPNSTPQLADRFSNAKLLGLSGLPPLTPDQWQGIVSKVSSRMANNPGANKENKKMWDKQSFIGLITPVGGFLLGRQYTPLAEMVATFDAAATQSTLSYSQTVGFPIVGDIRADNALAYRIKVNGLSGVLMYAPGEKSPGIGRLMGINGIYSGEQFGLGASYTTRNNELGQKSFTSTVLGASFKLGGNTFFTSLVSLKDPNPSGLSTLGASVASGLPDSLPAPAKEAIGRAVQSAYRQAFIQDVRIAHLGYKLNKGPHTFYAAYNLFNDRTASNADTVSFGGAYSYAFSKRTDASFIFTRFNNKGLAQSTPGQAGSIGGVTAHAGDDSNVITVGLRHRF